MWLEREVGWPHVVIVPSALFVGLGPFKSGRLFTGRSVTVLSVDLEISTFLRSVKSITKPLASIYEMDAVKACGSPLSR
jgi:hypothetical protein